MLAIGIREPVFKEGAWPTMTVQTVTHHPSRWGLVLYTGFRKEECVISCNKTSEIGHERWDMSAMEFRGKLAHFSLQGMRGVYLGEGDND